MAVQLNDGALRSNWAEKVSTMMLIYRGNTLEMDILREILGKMALQLGRRMLLALWDDGDTKRYMITKDDAPVARSPAFEPIVLALPNGACISVHREARTLQPRAHLASQPFPCSY